MNWQIRFKATRPHLPDDKEKDDILSHVRHVRDDGLHDYEIYVAKEPCADQTVLFGRVEIYYSDPDDSEVKRLMEALTSLKKLLSGSSLVVWDDLDLIGWDGSHQRYDTMGQCDVPQFELPPASGFLRLSSLSYDHRFEPLRRQGAQRVGSEQPAEVEGPIILDEAPAFFVTPGHRREEARMVFWLKPTLPLRVAEVVLAFSDNEGKLLDFEEHYLDLTLEKPTRVALVLSAPELLNLAHQVEIIVRTEATAAVPLGTWSIDATSAAGLSFLPPDRPIISHWPLELSLGGFVDHDYGRRQWRLVGQLGLKGKLREARGEIRFYLHDDKGQIIGHYVETIDPLLESRFGGWWTESHDELRTAKTMAVQLQLTVTEEVQLGNWTVPGRQGS